MKQNKLIPKWLRGFIEKLTRISLTPDCKPIVRRHRKLGRNEQCRCGCGRKYKTHLWAADVRNGIR